MVKGQAISKNDLVVVFVRQENRKVEKIETTAQNAMLYAHAGNGNEENAQKISGVYWIDSENGEVEIPIQAHQIPNTFLNGIKLRSTLFTGINLDEGKIDCRG